MALKLNESHTSDCFLYFCKSKTQCIFTKPFVGLDRFHLHCLSDNINNRQNDLESIVALTGFGGSGGHSDVGGYTIEEKW